MSVNIGVLLISLTLSFLITVIISARIIPVLKKKKLGQKILEIGPNWHKSKEGTPTMCGISFIIAITVSFLVICLAYRKNIESRELIVAINVLAFSLLNCLVGLIDDVAKIRKRKNEGLKPVEKIILQLIIAVLFLFSLYKCVDMNTELYIPYFDITVDLGFWYYIFCVFLICGIVNSVNLTDGIDGLASTVVITVGALFIVLGVGEYTDLSVFALSSSLVGGLLGFLVFNIHPAKAFMGDTGSLFLGGMVVGLSFAINNPVLAVIYGFVFVCEALSDVLQVAYFKVTKGKRLLKMAPFHHHLEKSGFSEMKIVALLGGTNVVFCILALFGLR